VKNPGSPGFFYGCTLRNLPRRSQTIPRQNIAKIRMASRRAAAAQAARKTSRQFLI
jgi:hypothetical protein